MKTLFIPELGESVYVCGSPQSIVREQIAQDIAKRIRNQSTPCTEEEMQLIAERRQMEYANA